MSQEKFAIDYTFWLNLIFLIAGAILYWFKREMKKEMSQEQKDKMSMDMANKGIVENILFWLAMVSYVWLGGGLLTFLW